MPKLNDLLAQKAALEKQIADAQREERASAIAQIKTLMTEHGLTLADLGGARVAAAGGKARKPAATPGKVAVKFRDSATGQTWTGRGLQPRWLKAALAAGRKLSDFEV